MANLKDLIVLGVSRFIGNVYGSKFITNGGTSSLFVKGDGTLDSTAYGTYSKPSGGIPKTDLASDVLALLDSNSNGGTIIVDLIFNSLNSTWTDYENNNLIYTSTLTLGELALAASLGKNVIFKVDLSNSVGVKSGGLITPEDGYYFARTHYYTYEPIEENSLLYYCNLYALYSSSDWRELIDGSYSFAIHSYPTPSLNNTSWKLILYNVYTKLLAPIDSLLSEAAPTGWIPGDNIIESIVGHALATGSNNHYVSLLEVTLSIDDIAINYATLDSPALTGTPTAPTASIGTNTTLIATTAFVLLEIGNTTYAGSFTAGGPANKSLSVPIATPDSTSTSKAFTVQIPEFAGETQLRDGLFFYLFNNVVAAASGYTLNVNGLGAKPVWTVSNARSTTGLTLNKMFPIWYNSSLDSGNGAWVYGQLSDTDTNTLGYLIRSNNGTLPMSDRMYRYRIYFTSADGSLWVPSNTSTSTDATTARSVNQRPINPFGPICAYSSTNNFGLGSAGPVTTGYLLLAVSLGYSFNPAGSTLALTVKAPVYVKCSPQSDGSAIIDATTPYTQSLPTTEDGYIYIFLGIAYNAALIELRIEHPVYYYKDGAIRIWTANESRIAALEARIAALEQLT